MNLIINQINYGLIKKEKFIPLLSFKGLTHTYLMKTSVTHDKFHIFNIFILRKK